MWPVSIAVRRILTVIVTVLLLGSCGSSDDSGGIGGTGVVVYGPVDEFGSVWVNGVRFDTSNAEFVVDGNLVGIGDEAIRENLAIGKLVRVEGSIGNDYKTGTAAKVLFDDDIEGPIEAINIIDMNVQELEILGQRVVIDDSTIIFSPNSQLNEGVMVEISALRHPDMGLRATHINVRSDVFIQNKTKVEVKGIISNFDDSKFNINGLLVDYSSLGSGELPIRLGNDSFVEVRGTYDGAGMLHAEAIELESEFETENADRAEIEGFITALTANKNIFSVGTQVVQILPDETHFEGGEITELRSGVLIEVEGKLVNSILIADEVSFSYEIELEADIETVDSGAQTLTLKVLPGIVIVIAIDDQTEISGGVGVFDEIASGDHAKIRGRMHADNSTVIARDLDVAKGADPVVMIQGVVNRIDEPVITILGVDVDTTEVEDDKFGGVNDLPTSRAAFFASVREGQIVRAKGETNEDGVMWQEIELEDDDG